MKISIIGTGYVGLVTGICLSDIGHDVICYDNNKDKIIMLNNCQSPIFEPGLKELIEKNKKEHRLSFTDDISDSLKDVQIIYIAVGTPESAFGNADLQYVYQTLDDICKNLSHNAIVVVKSTVPVGTTEKVKQYLNENLLNGVKVNVAFCPEFLREGSAIYDVFNADRIVIGTDNDKTADVLKNVNAKFNSQIMVTDTQSAELIKYASNAYLATKISFINEIGNLCECVGADIEEVSKGIGLDSRIGSKFLKAGIGYGGSCFPKDMNALVSIAKSRNYDFKIIKAAIEVNKKQQTKLVEKLEMRVNHLKNKKIAILGLAFKPNTDDMREAASIKVINELIQKNSKVHVYDPIAVENAKKVLPKEVEYHKNIDDAIQNSDAVLILTEWNEIISYPLENYVRLMKAPLILDGRNCYEVREMELKGIEYYCIGRSSANINGLNKVKSFGVA